VALRHSESVQMSEHQGEPASEWSVDFHFKLDGKLDLGHAGSVFADQIAAERWVSRVTDVSRPTGDSIRVQAIVVASSHESAEKRSDKVLGSARAAVGKTIPDWSTTDHLFGHDCLSPRWYDYGGGPTGSAGVREPRRPPPGTDQGSAELRLED
jgi:hypothetical protein